MTATARLDLRLTARDRARIDRAAALAGLPVAAFVRSAVLREADARSLPSPPRPSLLPNRSASWRPSRSPLHPTPHCAVP